MGNPLGFLKDGVGRTIWPTPLRVPGSFSHACQHLYESIMVSMPTYVEDVTESASRVSGGVSGRGWSGSGQLWAGRGRSQPAHPVTRSGRPVGRGRPGFDPGLPYPAGGGKARAREQGSQLMGFQKIVTLWVRRKRTSTW